jgi:AraC family transcriptional regulator, regulatory protein of adaptative response / methylated-DNA-[protein]-cysteine methyltransferase
MEKEACQGRERMSAKKKFDRKLRIDSRARPGYDDFRKKSSGGLEMQADAQWQRVLARDSKSDGAFVYAVRSTGIYCRPSCASRRPHRRQVVFFPLPAAAESAGFRPCRRCRPEQAKAADPQLEWVRRACALLDGQAGEPARLFSLAAQLNVSPFHLQRTFKRVMGISPREYQEARRMERLKKELKKERNVTYALYEAGFGSSSRLYEGVHAKLGMTPATYRRGGRGVTIRYSIVASPLGRLLVAATERGVCRVGMGASDGFLADDLRREFPAAEIRRDDHALRAWTSALLKQLNGWQPRAELPLDIRATAFQKRVWETLQKIPRGATRSYAEVARAIGKPHAARAVARACASNPVALLIPCHRVVESGGGLGGYHWGEKRKRALLEREKSPQGRTDRKA